MTRSSEIQARKRRTAIPTQGILLAIIVLIVWRIAHNAPQNLASRNIASGFGFLADRAGFAISESVIPFESTDPYIRAFLVGVVNTLRAALPAALLATIFGVIAGVGQISRHPLVRGVARLYVDVVRNIPLLVQILVWYFSLTELLPSGEHPASILDAIFLSKGGLAVPSPTNALALLAALAASLLILGFTPAFSRRMRARMGIAGWPFALALLAIVWRFTPLDWETPNQGLFGVARGATLSPEWLSLVLALSIYAGAYCAEIVRAGLQAVPKGQWEAGKALSLRRSDTLRRNVFPQAMRLMAPPYTSLLMSTIKNSSLAVAVGYPDIVSVAMTTLNQNGQAIECIGVIAAVYLAFNLLTAAIMARVNALVQITER